MIVAIFVFAPIGLPAWYWLLLTRVLGVPLIAGISFEIIKFAARHRDRAWVRAVMAPGLALQRLTTREPDHASSPSRSRRCARCSTSRSATSSPPPTSSGSRSSRDRARSSRRSNSASPSSPRRWPIPAVIGDRRRNAEVGRAYRQLEPAAALAAEWRHAQRRRRRRRGAARRGRRRRAAARAARERARAHRRARGGDPPRDGLAATPTTTRT